MKHILTALMFLATAMFCTAEALPFIQGNPQAWLVVGPWLAKGGLAITGVDAERNLWPNPGDYTPKISPLYTAAEELRWGELATRTGTVAVGTTSQDYSWASGTAYASLYVYSVQNTRVWLHSVQSGQLTTAWVNGSPVPLKADAKPPSSFATLNAVSTEKARKTRISLNAGWNRVLLKLVMKHTINQEFTFATHFTDDQGNPVSDLQGQIWDPNLDRTLAEGGNRLVPKVTNNAPSNLPHPGDALSVTFDTASLPPHGGSAISTFQAVLTMEMRDYTGALIATRKTTADFPGNVTLDFGTAPATGYYTLKSTLTHPTSGKTIATCFPDGFSVIGGHTSQAARKAVKKMAYTHYFLQTGGQDGYQQVFPWLQRMGVYRTVGSDERFFTPSLWKSAQSSGITATADYWDIWHNDSPGTKRHYASQVAPYTRYFKGFNEIDYQATEKKSAVPQRPTPAEWVAQTKIEYEKSHAARSDAFYIGGSLVTPGPGGGTWFQDCLAAGLWKYQDAWDVHVYPMTSPLLAGTVFTAHEGDIGIEKAHTNLGLTNTKPYWIGETGAMAAHGPTGRRWQADTTAKMVACALTHDNWQVISFLRPQHYDPGHIGDIEMGHMPGEAAYYTASALLDGLAYTPLPSTPAVALNNTVSHRVRMRLTRAGSALKITTMMDGVALPGTVYPIARTYTFDSFNLSANMGAAAFRADNVKIATSTSTLLNDLAFDGNFSNGANTGETDTQWYFCDRASGATAWDITTDNAAPLDGTVMNNPGGTSVNATAVAQWTAVTLSDGDWLELSFDFRCAAVPTEGVLGFSLRDSKGTKFSGNVFGGTSPETDDDGYGFSQFLPGTTGLSYVEIWGGATVNRGIDSIQAAKFDETRMLWIPGGGPVEYRLSLAGAYQSQSWVLVDVVGGVTPLIKNPDGVSATVTLTDSPVYVLPESVYRSLTL